MAKSQVIPWVLDWVPSDRPAVNERPVPCGSLSSVSPTGLWLPLRGGKGRGGHSVVQWYCTERGPSSVPHFPAASFCVNLPDPLPCWQCPEQARDRKEETTDAGVWPWNSMGESSQTKEGLRWGSQEKELASKAGQGYRPHI